jgi:hypothetical protein
MRKIVLNLVLLLSIGFSASAQNQNITLREVQEQNFARRIQQAGGIGSNQMAHLPMPPGERVNEVYMVNSWQKSIVSLYGSEEQIVGMPAKYELKTNTIEFKVKGDVKVMDVRRIKSLVLLDSMEKGHLYVNGKDYTCQTEMRMLLEVLSSGKFSLYREPTYTIAKPNYNVAMNVGEKDERVFRAENFYYAAGEDKKLTLLPPKKKAVVAIFGDKSEAVKKFMDDNNIRLSRVEDLAKVFDFYNNLN